MRISTHLDDRPCQVAVSADPKLPLRKWDHKGTCWCQGIREAAFRFGVGALLEETAGRHVLHQRGTVFRFAGNFVHVGFGS